jgi:hypothetical protein
MRLSLVEQARGSGAGVPMQCQPSGAEVYGDGVLSKARYEQRRDALKAQLATAPVIPAAPPH